MPSEPTERLFWKTLRALVVPDCYGILYEPPKLEFARAAFRPEPPENYDLVRCHRSKQRHDPARR